MITDDYFDDDFDAVELAEEAGLLMRRIDALYARMGFVGVDEPSVAEQEEIKQFWLAKRDTLLSQAEWLQSQCEQSHAAKLASLEAGVVHRHGFRDATFDRPWMEEQVQRVERTLHEVNVAIRRLRLFDVLEEG